jgi:hypothetical protein
MLSGERPAVGPIREFAPGALSNNPRDKTVWRFLDGRLFNMEHFEIRQSKIQTGHRKSRK